MLFLAFKKSRNCQIHSISSSDSQHLHVVSKVNVMKKNEKGHGENKCDVINIGKYDTQRHMQTCKQVTKTKSKNGGRKPQQVGMGVAIKNFILT